jgi:hypothetical protein
MSDDLKDIINTLGGTASVARMSHEARADALEEFEIAKLDAAVAALRDKHKWPDVAELDARIDQRGFRRGAGSLFRNSGYSEKIRPDAPVGKVKRLSKMPAAPTLIDFFKQRFAPGSHLLQSAALAKRKGEPEDVVLACLLHDIGGYLMKADHGYWGAQLIEPYVSEKVAFAVRQHQALRFFADPASGYEYPIRYLEAFGFDYEPPDYIKAAYDYTRNHKWYMAARHVTMNDLYSFNPNIKVDISEFTEIIGRHFKQPKEGLGFDNSPVAHMWRTMINPDAPL